MYSYRPALPPPYPEKLTIALFGKRVQLKNAIGNMILKSDNAFDAISNNFAMEENNSFKILNTPDFFDEDCLHPDQLIIDFMALSYPGPNLFILAIDSDNTEEERAVSQIRKLQEIFGEKITAHLAVMLPDIESFHALGHLRRSFNIRLALANENLAKDCKDWGSSRHSFLFDYDDYSQNVVKRRKSSLEKRRCNPEYHHGRAGAASNSPTTSKHAFAVDASLHKQNGNSAHGAPDNIFNVIVLGQSGTGKSASANTILAAGSSQRESIQFFKSEASSVPVTTQCEVKSTEKPFGMHVRVVDTPDFFNDQLKGSQTQVEECKKYCQQGQCVVLLVFQLGRFTESERGILENLEDKLGWMIRESTIVLMTHGDDLHGTSLDHFISANNSLKNIVEMCGNRYHVFNNSSKDTKQVLDLIKKIPNYKHIFPKFTRKQAYACMIC